MIESTAHFQTLAHEEHYQHHEYAVQLPKVERLSYDFLQLCRKRYSPDADFTLTKWDAAELATLLQEASLLPLLQTTLMVSIQIKIHASPYMDVFIT